jgi:hypothetical protein
LTIQDINQNSTEDGLHCLSELTYNQPTVSQTMWTFFNTIVTSILEDKGVLEEYLSSAFVPILNIMQKAP